MTNKSGRLIILLSLLSALFFISGCGISHAFLFGKSDKAILKERAEKYWNSKLTGDMITCYQLEEPEYRKKVPVSVYVRTGSIIYKEIKVKDIQIFDDKATVTVDMKYFIPALGSEHVFPSEFKDKWKKVGSEWYHVPEEKRPYTGHKINQEERR